MSEQLFRMVELTDGQLVKYVGVHALRWNFERWGQPQVGFIEADADDEEVGSDERE